MGFEKLPAGLTIQLALSDSDATAYVPNYLSEHNDQIKELIQQKIKVNLDITEPQIRFNENELIISCRAGIKFVKVNASVKAYVFWDGKNVLVDIKTLELPIVSIDASKANSLIQKPIQSFVDELRTAFQIKSFRVEPGRISVDAVKI